MVGKILPNNLTLTLTTFIFLMTMITISFCSKSIHSNTTYGNSAHAHLCDDVFV